MRRGTAGRGTDLLKPRMKVNGSHEQHPQRQSHNPEGELPPDAQIPLVRRRRRSAIRLDPGALDRAVAHNDGSVVSEARHLEARPEHDPDDLLHEEAAPEDEQEHVSGDVVPAAPPAPRRPARRRREELLAARGPRRHGVERDHALAPREPEPAVDERRPEAPLRDEDPPPRDERPARGRPGGHPAAPERGVRGDERDERDRDPQPPALDEEDVEQVVLPREVRRRVLLDVRLPRDVVGRPAGLGGQDGEQRAEDQDGGVRREEERFEGRG